MRLDQGGERAGGDALAPRPAQGGGEFGEAGLVVMDSEDELGDRRHRRARLRLEAGIVEQFGIIVRRLIGGQREIIGVAERAVERGAAARVAGGRLGGAVARGGEPVAEAVVGPQAQSVALSSGSARSSVTTAST